MEGQFAGGRVWVVILVGGVRRAPPKEALVPLDFCVRGGGRGRGMLCFELLWKSQVSELLQQSALAAVVRKAPYFA